nr:hypothetical protein SiHV1_ORF60 [Silurid herpesvirus 1]
MILSRATCDNLLDMPLELITNWRFKTRPDIPTHGITAAVAMLHLNAVRTIPGRGVVSKVGKGNDFLTYLFQDYNRLFKTGGDSRESILGYLLPPDRTETFFKLFREVEPFTKANFTKRCKEIKFSAAVGIGFDTVMKGIFNRIITMTPEMVPPMAKGLCSVLAQNKITPLRGGLYVGEIPRACGNHCAKCGADYTVRPERFVTEIDLVGFDASDNTCVLIEVKTYKNNVLPQEILNKYNTQAWISWFLFGLMYPHLRQRTKAIIAVITGSSRLVQLFTVRCPPITARLIKSFPFLGEYCLLMQRMMTSTSMRYLVRAPFVAAHVSGWGADVSIEIFNQSTKLPPNKWDGDLAGRREMERTRKARYRAEKRRLGATQEEESPRKRKRGAVRSSSKKPT